MDGTHPIDPGDANATLATEYTRHTYRSTIASTGQRSVRRAAAEQPRGGRSGGNETLSVTLELDGEKREIESRPDLVRALKAKPPAWVRWRVLSYSHQREHVEAIEDARKSETRARRIEGAVRMIASRPARPARTGK